MSVAFDEAWGFMKALPEQQQYQEMPELGGGFEQMTPQRRIGTVHPAIISMLRRLQSGKNAPPPEFRDDRPMPNLKTAPAAVLQDTRSRRTGHMRDVPAVSRREGRPFGSLVEMPYRRAEPGFEVHANETAMSPQFVDPTIQEPYVEGYSTMDTSPTDGIVAGGRQNTRTLPPSGSPQALVDEMARQAPQASAQVAAGEIDYGGPTLDEYAARLTGPNPRNRLASRLDELTNADAPYRS